MEPHQAKRKATTPIQLPIDERDALPLRLGLPRDILLQYLPKSGNIAEMKADDYIRFSEAAFARIGESEKYRDSNTFRDTRDYFVISWRTRELLNYLCVMWGEEKTIGDFLALIRQDDFRNILQQWVSRGKLCDPLFYSSIVHSLGKAGLDEVLRVGGEVAPKATQLGLLRL